MPTHFMDASRKTRPFAEVCDYQKKKIMKALANLKSYMDFYDKELARVDRSPEYPWSEEKKRLIKGRGDAANDFELILAGKLFVP